MFFFFDDPEGPNLLIVTVAAAIIFFISLSAKSFNLSESKRLPLAIFIQIVTATIFYVCLQLL